MKLNETIEEHAAYCITPSKFIIVINYLIIRLLLINIALN